MGVTVAVGVPLPVLVLVVAAIIIYKRRGSKPLHALSVFGLRNAKNADDNDLLVNAEG